MNSLTNFSPQAEFAPHFSFCIACELRIFFFIFKLLEKNQKNMW